MLTRWLDNLMLWQRFALLGVLGLFLVGPPLYLYVHNTNLAIDASVVEQQGIAPGKVALKLLQQIQQHRGLSAAFLGAGQLADPRQAKQVEADATLVQLEAQLKDVASMKPFLAKVHDDWATLENGVANKSISVLQSYDLHTALCQYMLKVLEALADEYGLSLDPDADTYYLMRSVYFDTATLTEMLGETRAKGASLLATKQIDVGARALMSGLIATSIATNAQMSSTLDKAFAANPALKGILADPLAAADNDAKSAIELGKTKVMAAETADYPAPDYIAFFTHAIDVQFTLIGQTVDQLDRLIQLRVSTQQHTRNLLMAMVVLIAGLAALVAWAIARSILAPVRQALATVQLIASGDLTSSVGQGGRSEMGRMLAALAEMQAALRETITSMRASADAVAQSASTMANSSHEVSIASARQSESSASMAAAVEQLTVSISHVTSNAGEAHQAASEAETLANDSAKVIQGTAESVHGVAGELRSTSAVMAQLGEQSQRISGIVSVIREVADQTNLLALNAAIEAARAGEAGRGFAVVADEVRKLAERTNQATSEISGMISLIQTHTSASVQGVNGAVALVDGSVERANRAADAIDRIASSATAVEGAIDVIRSALQEQMNASQQIAVNVERIAQMSEENCSSAQNSDEAAQALTELAARMRSAVDRFRLH